MLICVAGGCFLCIVCAVVVTEKGHMMVGCDIMRGKDGVSDEARLYSSGLCGCAL